MKKHLGIIILVFGLNLISSAQEVSLTKMELEDVLCKQWKIEYAMIKGKKIEQMPNTINFDFLFTTDGRYYLITDERNSKSGTWVYDEVNKTIVLSIENRITSYIKSINQDKMVVTVASESLQGTEIHFKPI